MVSLRNNVNLIGRLTNDVEERKTNNGEIPVCNFTIAVDRPGTSKDNRITDFFDLVAWRQTASMICKYFHKGDTIGIHGNLQVDKYTGKDGEERKKVVICVDSFEFMPFRKSQGEQAEANNDPVPEPVDTKDLPF